jgi:hypothetical protein
LGSKIQSSPKTDFFKLQLKKVDFLGSEMRAQKRDMQINRVTCLLIIHIIFRIKKNTFDSFYAELEVFFAIIQQT